MYYTSHILVKPIIYIHNTGIFFPLLNIDQIWLVPPERWNSTGNLKFLFFQKVIKESKFVSLWIESVKNQWVVMLITSLVYQYWKAVCFHFSFETPPIWKKTRLSTLQTFFFFFSLRYGYHTEFGKYCLYLRLTRKKMNFQNQIIGPGLIYFSLVFWPFSSPKSHVDIQSRIVSVCFMNNLTSSAPPLICREWEH